MSFYIIFPIYQEYRRPQLRIFEALQGKPAEEVALDELNMRGWEQYRSNDYRLG